MGQDGLHAGDQHAEPVHAAVPALQTVQDALDLFGLDEDADHDPAVHQPVVPEVQRFDVADQLVDLIAPVLRADHLDVAKRHAGPPWAADGTSPV